jgi:hypothetical protein
VLAQGASPSKKSTGSVDLEEEAAEYVFSREKSTRDTDYRQYSSRDKGLRDAEQRQEMHDLGLLQASEAGDAAAELNRRDARKKDVNFADTLEGESPAKRRSDGGQDGEADTRLDGVPQGAHGRAGQGYVSPASRRDSGATYDRERQVTWSEEQEAGRRGSDLQSAEQQQGQHADAPQAREVEERLRREAERKAEHDRQKAEEQRKEREAEEVRRLEREAENTRQAAVRAQREEDERRHVEEVRKREEMKRAKEYEERERQQVGIICARVHMHARIVTGCVGMIAKHFSCPDNIRESMNIASLIPKLYMQPQ